MHCLPAIASAALPINLLLDISQIDRTFAHRQRSPTATTDNRLRGFPNNGKPTFHPTYPDWTDRHETFDTDLPTNFPTYRASDDFDPPEPRDEDSPKRSNAARPTLHPTYPDWDSAYYYSDDYPTTYPTYGIVPTDVPTRMEWELYDTPTFSPTGYDEADRNDCEGGGFFQLDVATAEEDGCETSWRLVKLPKEVLYQGDGYKDGFVYDDVAEGCLEQGQYEFTIYDAGGDGIKRPGYYLLKLDGKVIAGGNEFGYNDTTAFSVSANSRMADPTATPAFYGSTAPSAEASSAAPSTAPSVKSSPSRSTAPSNDQLEISIRHMHDNWVQIIDENFDTGSVSFVEGGSNVMNYATFKDRSGVIAIHNSEGTESSLISRRIRLGEAIGDGQVHSKFKVVFSYYTYGMIREDGFCMDYSVDSGSNWHTEKCWNENTDFENDDWYDDAEVVFEPDVVDSLTLRIRCGSMSRSGNLLIDRIRLYDLHD